MRAWRVDGGYLVERGRCFVPSALEGAVPEGPWREGAHNYLFLEAGSQTARSFAAGDWCVEDEMGANVYGVFDGALQRLRMRSIGALPYDNEITVLMTGLTEVAADEQGPRQEIEEAVDRHYAELARAAEVRAQEVASRVDRKVPGARTDFEAGDDFRRAQLLLIQNVEGWDSSQPVEMLRVLVMLGELHRMLAGTPAVSFYVSACRVYANDFTFQAELPPIPDGVDDGQGHLFFGLPIAVLEGLHTSLLRDAQQMDDGDARLNAQNLRQTAAWVERATQALMAFRR